MRQFFNKTTVLLVIESTAFRNFVYQSKTKRYIDTLFYQYYSSTVMTNSKELIVFLYVKTDFKLCLLKYYLLELSQ